MSITRAIMVAAAILGSTTATALAAAGDEGGMAPAAAAPTTMALPMARSSAALVLPARQLARARVATARYASDLAAAKADGYSILTQKIPGMGYHFINPSVKGFDVRRPAILVYERHGSKWQLGALEWVFPKRPARPPLAGASYGSFPAACHYQDGTFVAEANAASCPVTSPSSGARFKLWHPELVTMHVWAWYPNPSGMYASMNPLVPAFG